MKTKNKFLLILVSIGILSWGFYQNKKIRIDIAPTNGQKFSILMSIRHKQYIEYFFKSLIIKENCGYTLFGNKPMSMYVYWKPFCFSKWYHFLTSIFPCSLRTYRGWKTWQKYQHFFPNSAFLLWAEPNPFFPENTNFAILLVNKEKFREVVSANGKDFETILGRKNISADELLTEAKNAPLLKTVLQFKEELFGILFGYGRENARLFETKRRGENVVFSAFPWGEEIEQFLRHRLGDAWWFFGNFPKQLDQFLGYPTFGVDPNSLETKKLKEEFLETRKRILEYYEGKDFLEATLSRLASSAIDILQ